MSSRIGSARNQYSVGIGSAARGRRRVRGAVTAAIEALEARTMLAAIAWTGLGDGANWSDAANWSDHALPAGGDDVTINVAGNPTVHVDVTATIHGLTSFSPLSLDVVGGGLSIAAEAVLNAPLTLAGGTLTGGTWSGGGGMTIASSGTYSVLDGVTLGTDLTTTVGLIMRNGLTLADNATITASGPDSLATRPYPWLYFEGTQTLGGNGMVELAGASLLAEGTWDGSSPATLTIGSGVTIGGLAGSPQHAYIGSRYDTDSLIVQGTIDANVQGQTLRLQGQTITNTGTLRASNGGTLDVRGIAGNAGTLQVTGAGSVLQLDGSGWVNNQSLDIPTGTAVTFSGAWSNTGGVHVTGGDWYLGGTFSTSHIGAFTCSGGTLNITGTLDNRNSTLVLNATNASWNLSFGTILGGTITSVDGTQMKLLSDYGTLDGVTIASSATLATGAAYVKNGLTLANNATLTVNGLNSNYWPWLQFEGTQALAGDGTISLGRGSIFSGADSGPHPTTLTIGPGVTINGHGQWLAGQYAGVEGHDSGDSFVVQGMIDADTPNLEIRLRDAALGAAAMLRADSGLLTLESAVALDGSASLASSIFGIVIAQDNLLGNTTNAAACNFLGTLRLAGTGTDASPQLLEAMSQDLGADPAGLRGNFSYGTLALYNNTYVKLVDQSNNSPGAGAEAVYAGNVIVPAGTTLDLNGLKVYARTAEVAGTVVGGSITLLPDGGPIAINTSTPGAIGATGEVDEWTFFARAGRSVFVVVNAGTGGWPAPASPRLDYADVSLFDPAGNPMNVPQHATFDGVVTLDPVAISADGTYRVRVHAPSSHADSTGNYMLGVWDVTPTERSLSLNQLSLGNLADSYGVDHWNFSASAGQQIRLHLVASPGSALTYTLTGPGAAPVFTNLMADSDLITLSATGKYLLTAQGTGQWFGFYSFRILQTAFYNLPVNTIFSGTLAGDGQAQLFTIAGVQGQSLRLALDDSTNTDQVEMYARLGSAPTRSSYDYCGTAASADQQILIPNTTGTWYVLLYATQVPDPSPFTLSAAAADLQVMSATPDHYANNAPLTMTITGAGFVVGAGVELIGQDAQAHPAGQIVVDSFTQITATFAAGLPIGTYSLHVTRPGGGSDTLPGAMQIQAAGQAHLETQLILPGVLGRHVSATLYVEYANTGNVAMPAPVLLLQSADPDGSDRPYFTLDSSRLSQEFWNLATPDGFSHSVAIVASGATPGLLQPGESFRVPVYYGGLQQPWDFGDTAVELEVRIFSTDLTTAIDWNSLAGALRPPAMSDQTWQALLGNLQAQIGDTWGDYVRKLDQDALYLSRQGQQVVDARKLWQFEMRQANGLGPVSTLDSEIDASVQAPGMDLTFSRTFGSTVTSRTQVGWFGDGWWSPWMLSASRDADGSVNIIGQGGSRRRFQPDSRSGNYFAANGDHSTLSVGDDGSITLQAPDGSITFFQPDGKLGYIQDANGNRITAGYTAGQLTSLTQSSGASLTIAWNAAGLVQSVTDSVGRSTTYTYDAANQYLLSSQTSDGRITNYTYDTDPASASQYALTSVQLPCGKHNYFGYDAQGRLSGIWRDDNQQRLDYTYDSAGTVTVTDALSQSVSLFYDASGLLVKQTDALGNATGYTYDANYNLVHITDALGQRQSLTYDQSGHLASTTDPLGQTYLFYYGGTFGQLSVSIDPAGNITHYAYDADGNLLSIAYPDGSVQSYNYDAQGDALSYVNRRGQTVAYEYNSAGQTTRETFADGSHNDYAYNSHGNMTSATDASGATTFQYDAADHMTQVTYPDGRFLSFTYNAIGLRTQMADQDGFTVKYVRDQARRLWELTDASDNVLVTYTYDAAGRLIGQDNANGTYTTWDYDANGQMLHLVNHAPGGSVNSRFDYTYDALGRCITMATLDGAWTYTYDPDSRLTHAVFASTNLVIPSQDLAYSYDAMGNRVSTVLNGTTAAYTTNDLDQYTAIGGAALSYDADGNLISRTDGGQTTTYTYDALSRLTGVTSPTDTWTYQYNTLGQRSAITHNGQTTDYLVDPIGRASIVGEYDASGLVADYTYGLGLVSRAGAVGATAYYDFDAVGSTADMTDAAGAVVNSYSYLPFGGALAASGTLANTFQYVGQWGVVTQTSGLDIMGARAYSPDQGRFISPDPLGLAQPTQYAYAQNDPMDQIDPLGLDARGFGQGFGGYFGAAGCATNSGMEALVSGSDSAMIAASNKMHEQGGELAYALMKNSSKDMVPTGKLGQARMAKLGWDLFNLSRGLSEGLKSGSASSGGCKDPGGPGGPDGGPGGPNAPGPTPPGGGVGPRGGSGIATASDPNDLIGPSGFGAAGYVSADALFSYRVDFENEASATAPAQQVVVTNQLNSNFDLSTFELTDIGFGDTLISVPAHSRYFQTTVPMTYNGQTFDVQIEISLNTSTGLVTARYQSIDPATGLPPDVLTGFLPPEDGTGRGMGHFSYTIGAKSGLPSGTQVRNVALISFDGQPQIATNQADPHDPSQGTNPAKECLNTIDSGAPVSEITTADGSQGKAAIRLTWDGQDDADGSGVAGYDIYVSIDSSAYELAMAGGTGNSAEYVGQPDHTYRFYTVATDNVGNKESAPGAPDATLTLWPTEQAVLDSQHKKWSFIDEDGTPVAVSWTGKGTATLERWRNPANGRGNLRSITVDGSDAASGLTIATTGQKVDTAVETITVRGPMGTLAAATTDLLGLLDVQGTLVKATFDEAAGATIQIGGTPTSKPATLVFDQVRDTSIVSGMPIASLKAAEWLDTDGLLQEIRAPWIGTLSVAGKTTAAPKIAGDFAANLTLSGNGVAAKGKTLGAVTIKGSVAPSVWDLTGPVGALTVKGTVGAAGQPWILRNSTAIASLTFGDVIDGQVQGAANIGAVKATRWQAGSLSANTVTSISTTGAAATKTAAAIPGDFAADLSLAGVGVTPKTKTLGSASIKGSVGASIWDLTGLVGTLAITGTVGTVAGPWQLVHPTHLGGLTLGDVTNATVSVSGESGAIKAKRWLDGSIQAARVASTTMTGVLASLKTPGISGDFAADVTVTGTGKTTLTMAVAGWLDGAAIASPNGPLGSIALGGIRNSAITAGDDTTQTLLSGLTVKGIKGQAFSFINSNVSAWALGTISVKGVQTGNGSQAHGITGHRITTSYTRDGKRLAGPTVGPKVIEQVDDFLVELV
jgi:RHS repeat-associated protein